MNYATLKKFDIANGPGVRVSLFVSGCRHHCKNCFNQVAWDFSYGEEFNDDVINEIISSLDNDFISGFSLLGGEPFERENQDGVLKLLKEIKTKLPQKSVWCYTGFDFETQMLNNTICDKDTVFEILKYIDVLIDGKFVEELKSLDLMFRGSSNQRIIDVKKSLQKNKVVLLEGEWTRKNGSTNIYE